MTQNRPQISIIMGSQSDWGTMQNAANILQQLNIAYEKKIISAHRTPHRMYEYAQNLGSNDIQAVIAGAGGAAHLPGMVAALTNVPVLGVPVESKSLKGMDSLLSIVQMPGGVPVATFAIGKAGAINAALFAASLLANNDDIIAKELGNYREKQTNNVTLEPK
jgi:5-(carboxyamino)imidazole ribonucleotide mutase